jgi:hypothetical protein
MPETKKKNFQWLLLDVDPKTGKPRTRPATEVLREDAELFGGMHGTILNTMAKFVETYEAGWERVYGTKIGNKVLNSLDQKVDKFMKKKGWSMIPPAVISEEERQLKAKQIAKAKQAREDRKSGLMQ